MLPAEVMRQIRRLQLRARRAVQTLLGGEYHSVFKGAGLSFEEVREYQPGDDVRSIDWNVTARMGAPFIKRFVEERELTVLLLVDCSGSARFGTAERDKRALSAELAAVLALTATRNNDRVGLVLFSDGVEHVVPPRKGRRHALRLVRDVLAWPARQRLTDLAGALDHAARLLSHHAIVFVISDWVAPNPERALRRLRQRHDVVGVVLDDPGERDLPSLGVARLVDPETGVYLEVDTSDSAVRRAYAEAQRAERAERTRRFRRLAIDEVRVRTEAGYVDALLRFFATRETRARRRARR